MIICCINKRTKLVTYNIGYYMYISHVFLGKCSFEKSPRHDSYMRKFEAELAQQCEKLVSYLLPSHNFLTSIFTFIYSVAGNGFG